MKLQEAIDEYLMQVKATCTKTTFLTYQFNLRQLMEYLVQQGYDAPECSDLTARILRRYMTTLEQKKLRPRTIRGCFHPIRSLCKMMVEEGYLESDPASSVKLPKRDAAQRLTVSEEEMVGLLDACERIANKRKRAFYRAVVGTLVFSGLRRQEVLDLKMEHFDPVNGSLYVAMGKGRKARKVFLCEEGVNILREWLAVREPDCSQDWLLMCNRGRRLGETGLRQLLEEVKAIAGYAGRENIKPHSLRHGFASRLHRQGASLKEVGAFLGHSSPVTTAIYLHVEEEELRQVANLGSLHRPSNADHTSNDIVEIRRAGQLKAI